jgi:hypothetical protein
MLKDLSIDIVQYLQSKKGLSVEDISKSMDTSEEHIKNIIDKKAFLTTKNIDSYLKNTNTSFWKFAEEAIPSRYLSEKTKRKILICKEMTEALKKRLESER